MDEIFHMGGYAFYVWSAYGAAFAVIVALVWHSVADYRAQTRLAETLEKAAGGRVRRAAHLERETGEDAS
ncbi:heme exporter protein CcmD [Parvibaculum sp.]|jgi:heme exporter protein D|uniref:heme exporter protein CcmD n=1 Tax=Parvibaculum sp. TaxID=2024848 RepID=UPI000C44D0FD|nr:heme exporter protein CcmD [Parvibaculum sp.]MAM96027.1 heme exporter protein CcmD [Parvibaculum sp.]|tara:strand:+ start:2649 stop:2858 length:210 start_codon:yes stop_codon:yes gene_type:complete